MAIHVPMVSNKHSEVVASTEFRPLVIRDSEAAKMLGISRGAFRKLNDSGKVPAPVRLGRRVLWRVAELEAWLESGCPPRHRWEWKC